MKKLLLLFGFWGFFLLPHLGNATGINIEPGTPLYKLIIGKEKKAIENRLAEDGKGAWTVKLVENFPRVLLPGRTLCQGAFIELMPKNAKTGQITEFQEGTKIWFVMMRSENGNGNYEEVPSSDNWAMGYTEKYPYLLTEGTRPSLKFSGEEIIKRIGTGIGDADSTAYCLYIWIELKIKT